MDEIIEKVADLVSTLVIAVRDSEEKNTRFGDMVPAAEMIRKSADGIFILLSCFYCFVVTRFLMLNIEMKGAGKKE